MSLTTTEAPRAARSSANSRPSPRPAPVTIATRLANETASNVFPFRLLIPECPRFCGGCGRTDDRLRRAKRGRGLFAWRRPLAVTGGIEDCDGIDECGAGLLDNAVLEDPEGDRRVVDVREPADRGHGALDDVRPGDAEVDRGRD